MNELYELPEGWEWKTLSDFVENPKKDIVDGPFGSNLKASEYKDFGIPIIRLQNIDRFRFIDKEIKYISEDKAEKLRRHNYQKGDLVITKLGSPLGKCCTITDENEYGIIVADIVRARINEESTVKKFVEYGINSDVGIQQLNDLTKGATRPRVNLNHIRGLKIPSPNKLEQQRIVLKLDALFEKIDKAITLHVKNMEEADGFMASVLNEVFSELEEKYEKYQLGSLVKIIGGGTPSKNEPKYWNDGTILWATVGDMNVEKIEKTELSITPLGLKESSSNVVPKEAIVIATRVGLGKVCYLASDIAINQDLKGLLPLNDTLNIRYLFNFFQYIKSYLIKNGTGATVKGVKLDFIKLLEVPLPSISTQQKIVIYLDDLSSKIEHVKKVQKEKMESLKALKVSILDSAFRGEL